MTRDSTTESSTWRPPSGAPTAEEPPPAPQTPKVDEPDVFAPRTQPGYGAFRAPGDRPLPGKGMALGALWTGVGALVLGSSASACWA